PSLPLRRLPSAQVRFSAPGPAAPRTSSSIAMVSSWFLWRRISAQAHGDGHTLLLDVAERHVEQCPLRSLSASNRFALPRRSVWWRAARAADAPPRKNAGRHCAKESSHLARLVPPIPSRQLYGCVEKLLSRLRNLVGAFANFSPLLFRRGVANLRRN